LSTNDLITRTGAGIIYILVILVGVLGGQLTFLVVFGAILGTGLFEFYRMVEKTLLMLSARFTML